MDFNTLKILHSITQKRKLFDLAILLFVFGYTVLGQETFNCKRHTGVCGNGGSCNPTTLKCDCDTGFHGYRCHIPDASPCTNTSFCGSNGECYVANGTNVCGCNLAYLGPKCEINRAEVKCDGSGMDVTFRILKVGFNGAIMANDTANSKLMALPAACTFADDTENAGYLKMIIKVGQPTVNAPNECLTSYYTEVNDAVKGKSTTAYFRLLYVSRQAVVSTLDLGYSIRCDLKKDDLEVFSEVSNVAFDPSSGTTIDKNATFSPVKLEIQKMDGTPLGTVVNLGDQLKLLIFLTDNIIYKALTVASITGNNTLEGNATQTFTFYANGCPTSIGQQIAGQQAAVKDADGKPGRSITMDMFKFPDSNKVGLIAKMQVCENANDTLCQVPTDCDAVRKATESADTSGAGSGGTTTNSTTTDGSMNSTGGASTGTGGDAATGNGTATGGDASTGNGTTTGTSGDASGNGANTNNGAAANNGTTTNNGAGANNGATTNNGAGANNGATTNNGAGSNNGAGARKKRKRRATKESEQVLSTVLNIRGPESLNPSAGTASPLDQVEECFTQKEILAAIIILGATVCVLFIACFVMCCLLLNRRGSKSSFGSLSNTKLSDRFHIPRVHVNEHINEAYTSL